MGVLLSSHAQESQNAAILPKIKIRLCRKIGPQHRCGLIGRKNPLRVSIQLLIFRSYDTTRAIDVLLLRVGCQQVD